MEKNFSLMVSSLWGNRLARDHKDFLPTHLISIVNVNCIPVLPICTKGEKRFIAEIDDIVDVEHKIEPDTQLHKLDAFIDELVNDLSLSSVRTIVHCHLGVSRSTAIAYVLLARAHPELTTYQVFDILLKVTNKPWPNRGIVSYFDVVGDYRGRLLAPLDRYRAAFPKRLEVYRRYNKITGRT